MLIIFLSSPKTKGIRSTAAPSTPVRRLTGGLFSSTGDRTLLSNPTTRGLETLRDKTVRTQPRTFLRTQPRTMNLTPPSNTTTRELEAHRDATVRRHPRTFVLNGDTMPSTKTNIDMTRKGRETQSPNRTPSPVIRRSIDRHHLLRADIKTHRRLQYTSTVCHFHPERKCPLLFISYFSFF